MSIEQNIKEQLQQLDPSAKLGKIIVEAIQSSVEDISDYLSQEKIYHCSLPDQDKVVVSYASLKEIEDLDNAYSVNIAKELRDANGHDVLPKMDPLIGFDELGLMISGGSLQGYDAKDKGFSGFVETKKGFDAQKYGVNDLTQQMKTYNGTFEGLFAIILDPDCTRVEGSRRLNPLSPGM